MGAAQSRSLRRVSTTRAVFPVGTSPSSRELAARAGTPPAPAPVPRRYGVEVVGGGATLVIAGGGSTPVLGPVARILAAALPDARFVELEGSGPVTHLAMPDEFAAAVAASQPGSRSIDTPRAPGRGGPRVVRGQHSEEVTTMTGAREAVLTRVSSVDGTEIACWTTGDGPPLVLVHGTTADHTRWAPVLPHLEPHFTVHAIDRRGRGASGDAADYTVEREYDDVAAVVDAVAAQAGAAVDLLGHSFGGVCAFGAATRTSHLRRLVLYEGWPTPHPEALALPADVEQRMDALLAAGDREGVLEVFFREIVQMPEADLAIYRALPAWQARIGAAHTIARETPRRFQPELAARITVPVLMLVGADSPEELQGDYETVAAALPDARVGILEGQQHIAIDLVPEDFAQRVTDFLRPA